MTPTHDLFLHYLNIAEAEKKFSTEFTTALSGMIFEPFLPNVLKSSPTIIVYNADQFILNHSEDEIRNEMEQHNITCNVSEVKKTHRSRTIKTIFPTSNMAQNYGNIGINMFCLHIPSFPIRRDKFMKVPQCYVCYAIDSHISTNYPVKEDNPSFMVYSNCSSTNHQHHSYLEHHNLKCVN